MAGLPQPTRRAFIQAYHTLPDGRRAQRWVSPAQEALCRRNCGLPPEDDVLKWYRESGEVHEGREA